MNDKKGKSVKKYCGRNATLKIKLLSLFVVAIFSIFSLNEVFAMDSVKKELYTKYSFKRMPNFVVPRLNGANTTVLQDGRVLFTGGNGNDGLSLKSAEIYDPQKNKFYLAGNFNEARTNHSSILLINGDVLICGGKKYEKIRNHELPGNIHLLYDIKNMPEVMSKCDVAISSRGRTAFELALMGIPAVVIAQNKQEQTHEFISDKNGFDYLGINPSCEIIKNHLDGLIWSGSNERFERQQQMLKNDLRNGRQRVIHLIRSL